MPPTSPPSPRRPYDARLDEIEQRLREVRKAIKEAARGRPVDLPHLRAAEAGASPAPDETSAPAPATPERPRAAAPPHASTPTDARARPVPPPDRERFAQYFSGSFLGGRPEAEVRRLQRNRALFMLALAVVLGYVLWHLLSR